MTETNEMNITFSKKEVIEILREAAEECAGEPLSCSSEFNITGDITFEGRIRKENSDAQD